MIDILSYNIRLDGLFILCPHFLSFPYRKAVEFLSPRCPGSRLFLWEPRGRDLCDNMAREPALYGHDKDPSDTSVHRCPQTAEVAIRGAALRLIHLFGDGFLETPSWFSSDFPRVSRVVGVRAAVEDIIIILWPSQGHECGMQSFLFGASDCWLGLRCSGHDFRCCVKRRVVRPLLVRILSRAAQIRGDRCGTSSSSVIY